MSALYAQPNPQLEQDWAQVERELSQWQGPVRSPEQRSLTINMVHRSINPFERLHAWYPAAISRAYFKMMEMARAFGWDTQQHWRRSLHLCEAPGGFVQAMLQLIPHLEWYAVSLPDDISWHASLSPKRLLGADLLQADPTTVLPTACLGSCDLVTADGGRHVTGGHEIALGPLLTAETHWAVHALRPGGVFVLKMYHAKYEGTHHLLWYIYQRFDQVGFYKPLTSRIANGERYLIARGFRAGVHSNDNPPPPFAHLMCHGMTNVFLQLEVAAKQRMVSQLNTLHSLEQIERCRELLRKGIPAHDERAKALLQWLGI